MHQMPTAQQQLSVVDHAPGLRRPAGVGERVAASATLLALYAILAASAGTSLPLPVRVLVLLAALAGVLRWQWFHANAPGRRLHNHRETGLYYFGLLTLGIPGSQILWSNPTGLATALIAPAIPTLGLAAFLLLRLRR